MYTNVLLRVDLPIQTKVSVNVTFCFKIYSQSCSSRGCSSTRVEFNTNVIFLLLIKKIEEVIAIIYVT